MISPTWIPPVEELSHLGFKDRSVPVPLAATLRRRLSHPEDDPWETLTLMESESGFSFELGTGLRPVGLRSARRGGIVTAMNGTPVWTSEFERLAPGQLKTKLDAIDKSLTPTQGLFRWRKDGVIEEVQAPQAKTKSKRILLLVHGTFSHGAMYEKAFSDPAGPGKDFLDWAFTTYDEILLFNHPTLAVPAWLNASELARLFDGCAAKIDVICHSRGGLVVRWWLDVLRPGRADTRVIYVAVPLAGTGLASPPRLTETLNYLANFAGFLGTITDKVGDYAGWAKIFFSVGAGLMQIVSTLIRGAAAVGVADAAVHLIPGFMSMARMSNNSEIKHLRRLNLPTAGRFAIKSNYDLAKPGLKLWRYVTEAKKRLENYGADVLFAADNDLVVDTGSMDDLQQELRIPSTQVYDFKTSQVHHCAYFAQVQTYRFMRKAFA